MLCPSCNNFRPANNTPCPLCYAPSPLGSNDAPASGNVWASPNATGGANSWGGPMTSDSDWSSPPPQQSFSPSPWQDFASGNGMDGDQQFSFPSAPGSASGNGSSAQWPQNGFPTNPARPQDQVQSSMLPMNYQNQNQNQQAAPASQALMVMPGNFPTIDVSPKGANPFLPALPDPNQEGIISVPPMYTNPRPIIPRYRAISGLLSVIIVAFLLCSGSAYYAKTTGKLNFVHQFFSNYTPPSMASAQNSQGTLKIPSVQATYGPGHNMITSAGLSNSVDQTTGLISSYVNQFNVGQTMYMTCSIMTSAKPGQLMVKWYMNGNLYNTVNKDVTNPQKENTGIFQMAYAQASEGKVEIYWNNQLAVTLLFVVQPVA